MTTWTIRHTPTGLFITERGELSGKNPLTFTTKRAAASMLDAAWVPADCEAFRLW